ncbi:hypothetical protein, partial [Pseudonocardia sp.]|uniref:hypothetical protein n=1 Tax=Pseudonocardia sp. TaxID=60912 RepID=UPI0026129733
ITTILLSPGAWNDDSEIVAELNRRLATLHPTGDPAYWQFRQLRDAFGGSKTPPAISGAALKNFPFVDFCGVVVALPWSEPKDVQVMVMFPEAPTYEVLTVSAWRGGQANRPGTI